MLLGRRGGRPAAAAAPEAGYAAALGEALQLDVLPLRSDGAVADAWDVGELIGGWLVCV